MLVLFFLVIWFSMRVCFAGDELLRTPNPVTRIVTVSWSGAAVLPMIVEEFCCFAAVVANWLRLLSGYRDINVLDKTVL